MKYPEIVAKAREVARETREPRIVYHNLENNLYKYATKEMFEYMRESTPIIRMLLCLPNGAVVQ